MQAGIKSPQNNAHPRAHCLGRGDSWGSPTPKCRRGGGLEVPPELGSFRALEPGSRETKRGRFRSHSTPSFSRWGNRGTERVEDQIIKVAAFPLH